MGQMKTVQTLSPDSYKICLDIPFLLRLGLQAVCDLQVFQRNPVRGKCVIVGCYEVLFYTNNCVKHPKIKNTEGCRVWA